MRKCIDDLKEELEIRDRTIAEKESRLQEREDVIETLHQKMRQQEKTISNLQSQGNRMAEDVATKKKQNRHNGRNSAKSSRANMEEQFGRGTFNRYYVITCEREKRKICPFQMERDIAQQVGGPAKSITESGPASVVVEIETQAQGDNIRAITNIAERKCAVKAHAEPGSI